ncbi:hypothetical protein GCM10010869_45200 [Mesorhizobium tianshanense]|nr:hypothetical protein GCM10010869_45200 [Mesorhizobium tianshanense]
MPPASDGSLALVEPLQQLQRKVHDPAMHGGMIDAQAAFGHLLLQVARAEIAGKVPAHAQ